jgi:hypothetical protein
MADRGLHAMLVRTFLALVMLSACSQDPAGISVSAEKKWKTSEPAQERRAATGTDCRDEVASAFERLKTSSRPYRKEVTFTIGDDRTFRGTVEFLPPDRMREIKSRDALGVGTFEIIQVGQRAWSNVGGWPWDWRWPWGWREWDPRFIQMILEKNRDFSALAHRPIAAEAEFECLGKVEFEGSMYIGYRTRWPLALMSAGPPSQELLRQLQQWHTVFIDPQSMLPAYELQAQENQLDSPIHKVRYTYPNDIQIEPPLWCRIGLCPFVPGSERVAGAAARPQQ